ncbi:AbgT family transporter, partial [Candidatus Cyanaurora vandensis]
MATEQSRLSQRNWVDGWLDGIKAIGNRLPHPLTLFFWLALAVPLVSWLVAQTGWTLIHPTTQVPVTAVNLLAPAQLRRILTEAVTNFTRLPPLGGVLVAMLGIGVAERAGLIVTLLKLLVVSVPPGLLTGALVFTGVMSSAAVDAGFVILTSSGGGTVCGGWSASAGG